MPTAAASIAVCVLLLCVTAAQSKVSPVIDGTSQLYEAGTCSRPEYPQQNAQYASLNSIAVSPRFGVDIGKHILLSAAIRNTGNHVDEVRIQNISVLARLTWYELDGSNKVQECIFIGSMNQFQECTRSLQHPGGECQLPVRKIPIPFYAEKVEARFMAGYTQDACATLTTDSCSSAAAGSCNLHCLSPQSHFATVKGVPAVKVWKYLDKGRPRLSLRINGLCGRQLSLIEPGDSSVKTKFGFVRYATAGRLSVTNHEPQGMLMSSPRSFTRSTVPERWRQREANTLHIDFKSSGGNYRFELRVENKWTQDSPLRYEVVIRNWVPRWGNIGFTERYKQRVINGGLLPQLISNLTNRGSV